MSTDNRTTAEILGPAKVAGLMDYAGAADDVLEVVMAYGAKSGNESLEDLLAIVRAALADHVPMATNLPC